MYGVGDAVAEKDGETDGTAVVDIVMLANAPAG